MNPEAARLNVQLRGSKFADKDFADLPEQTKVESVADFQKQISWQQ